jgi:hypothetical protein
MSQSSLARLIDPFLPCWLSGSSFLPEIQIALDLWGGSISIENCCPIIGRKEILPISASLAVSKACVTLSAEQSG